MVGQRLITSALLLLLPAGSLLAAPDNDEETSPRLDVEYVIFAVDEDAIIGDETYPADPGLPSLQEAVKAGSTAARDADMRSVAPDRLGNIASTLEESDEYRVLLHEAWHVSARSRENARLARVFLDEREPSSDTTGSTAASSARFQDEHLIDTGPTGEADTTAGDDNVDVARPLDGTLKVYLNRYYHVAADLLFNPEVVREQPDPEQQARERTRRIEALLSGQINIEEFGEREAAESERFLGYRLTESRRIGTGELHYFDHPRFGLIIRVDELPADAGD